MDDRISDFLFDVDLGGLPSSSQLGALIGGFLDEATSNGDLSSATEDNLLFSSYDPSSEFCAIISPLGSTQSMHWIKPVQSLDLELTGSIELAGERTIRIFKVQGHDPNKSKNKRCSIFVYQLRS